MNTRKNKMIATPKSETRVPPVEIIDVADDGEDDDISLLYARKTTPIFKNVISVDQSGPDTELRLSITASVVRRRKGNPKRRKIIDLDDFPDDDEVQVLESPPPPPKSKFFEMGQSSNSNSEEILTFVCEICVDTKPYSESFSIMGCNHFYCSECMVNYISSKLQENITQIRCPVSGCNKGLLEPEHCRPILPPEVFDRWGSALCEAVILSSEKFYCPYKDCSALMINDGGGGAAGGGGEGAIVTESECPNCRRLFCAQCKVPWHAGILCAEFQQLNKDERGKEDLMLMQLAREKKWTRCPKCKFFVEKSEGCLFMRCRCGHTFCYNCGAFMIQHFCTVCKR